VSPGCANCYAESYAKRFRAGVPFDTITLHEDRLSQPSRWKRPRKIFVGSLSDIFHAAIPLAYRDLIFLEMVLAGQHTFLVLTKRIDLAEAYLTGLTRRDSLVGAALNAVEAYGIRNRPTWPEHPTRAALKAGWPLANVWIGTSVENQALADQRIPILLNTPAAVRFLSAEPLVNMIHGRTIRKGIDWVIVGGESGPNARPMNPEWAVRLMAACHLAGIPFFMKQLGGWPNKRDVLDGFPPELRVRQFPATKGLVKAT
jgi:protein gp37